jgi:hypothetical protein
MTPKEKAGQLVDKMWVYAMINKNGSWNNAKQCALIAVDEIIANIEPSASMDVIAARIEYWQQVKTEIQAL